MKAFFTTLLPLACALPLAAQSFVCSATQSAPGCGPSLDVSFRPIGTAGNQQLTLAATGLHGASHGLMVWGTTPINVPLGNGCSLLTDFLWGHLFMTDDTGFWTWSRSWPASVTGQFYMQVGSFQIDPFGALDIRASDCQFAVCANL